LLFVEKCDESMLAAWWGNSHQARGKVEAAGEQVVKLLAAEFGTSPALEHGRFARQIPAALG
jgi:hypothetical protein